MYAWLGSGRTKVLSMMRLRARRFNLHQDDKKMQEVFQSAELVCRTKGIHSHERWLLLLKMSASTRAFETAAPSQHISYVGYAGASQSVRVLD